MVFNSLPFAIFLPVVFGLYWAIGAHRRRGQNALVLTASLFFYGWWDWRFLSLMVISTVTDYVVGLQLERTESARKRRLLLAVSLAVNLGLLGVFKYYDFFAESLAGVLRASVGFEADARLLNLVLPVGISFYTFQTLSYSIDVFRRRIPASHDFVEFATFVTFFPQLVAGPIERAEQLLPQFQREREFDLDTATLGLRQILWGLFKKVAIADTAALFVDPVFAAPSEFAAPWLWLAALLFSVQIYCDFSGYSDIAIGTARLFGIRLMQNFAYPYFSRDIAEFWRRWHISLSTWFRDYVYFPLGGSRGGRWLTLRNVTLVFLVSALWHGANWTFIVWGAIHVAMYVPLLLSASNRNHLGDAAENRVLPDLAESRRIAVTFLLVTVAWVFFRADSITAAIDYLVAMFSAQGTTVAALSELPSGRHGMSLVVAVLTLFTLEWLNRKSQFALEEIQWARPLRHAFYIASCLLVLDSIRPTQFIYFQF